MRNRLIFFFTLALILSIQSCLASIDLITPLTLSSADIYVGDSLTVYAEWNGTVNSSLIEYNSTSEHLLNRTTGMETENNTWTNYTIKTTNDWLLGPHPIRIYVLSTFEQGDVSTSTNQSSFNLWGYSKTSTQLTSEEITMGDSVTLTCQAIDVNTSNPIAYYYVEAHSSLEGDIESVAGLTDENGYNNGTFTPTEEGTHVITCLLYDDTSKFYTVLANSSSNLTVIQPETPEFDGRGILNVEKALTKSGLIEMPKGLNATLNDYNIIINNEEDSTMNFSLYIGNQLVLEDSILANDKYTINYTTIMNWKETYHLVNLHKVRIKVEGTHGFKSLITQNFTDVEADITVNKKDPKKFEINVSSDEDLKNVSMEGTIPPQMDIDKIKLYHWKKDNEAYEDVTDSDEYDVEIDKTYRKITFTVPSLSTQSFILMEGDIVTTTTTTIETTTTLETTTTIEETTTTTTTPACPTCSSPSAWSECVDGKKSRTVYVCSEDTDYECQSITEIASCVVPISHSTVIGAIILILILILLLIWVFQVLGKLPGGKFKYKYKPKGKFFKRD